MLLVIGLTNMYNCMLVNMYNTNATMIVKLRPNKRLIDLVTRFSVAILGVFLENLLPDK